MPEKFDPKQFKSFEKLPEDQKLNFKEVEGGFVYEKALSKEEAELEAEKMQDKIESGESNDYSEAETKLQKEQISKNKERLLTLEKEGKFVFHGSLYTLEKLEPKQAKGYDNKTEKTEKDGAPAIFASPYVDVAIFRALINEKTTSEDSSSGFSINDSNKINFYTTQNLLDISKGKVGEIYVLDKKEFDNFEGTQCRCEKAIIPIEVISVTTEDLPRNIKII
jgi:hypothetical protein